MPTRKVDLPAPTVSLPGAEEIYRRFCATPLRLKKPRVPCASPDASQPPKAARQLALPQSPAREQCQRRAGDQASSAVLSSSSPPPQQERVPIESAVSLDGNQKRPLEAETLNDRQTTTKVDDVPHKRQRTTTEDKENIDVNIRDKFVETEAPAATGYADPVRVCPTFDESVEAATSPRGTTRTPTTKPSASTSANRPRRRQTRQRDTQPNGPQVQRRSRRLLERGRYEEGQECEDSSQIAAPIDSSTHRAVDPIDEGSVNVPTASDSIMTEDEPTQVLNFETELVEPLYSSKTTSGDVFGEWFRALGQDPSVIPGEWQDVLFKLHTICVGISKCERLARQQTDDDLVPTSARKGVRFRHFDLSSINLDYSESSAVDLVQAMLTEYEEMRTLVETIVRTPEATTVLAFAVAVLKNISVVDTHTSGSKTEFEACRRYFADEFSQLCHSASTAVNFLEHPFSVLSSSLIRYRLRVLFLPFDPQGLVDEFDQNSTIITVYEHQDFGAAFHRALRDMWVGQPFAETVARIVDQAEKRTGAFWPSDKVISMLKEMLELDDVDMVQQYVGASRFLLLSLDKCVLDDENADEETQEELSSIERLCAQIKRFGFQDEAHLHPLGSFSGLYDNLQSRESTLKNLEMIIASLNVNRFVEMPCLECNELITSEHQAESIRCVSCDGAFHLVCLHLPASFAQFAGQYTCPRCFIGSR